MELKSQRFCVKFTAHIRCFISIYYLHQHCNVLLLLQLILPMNANNNPNNPNNPTNPSLLAQSKRKNAEQQSPAGLTQAARRDAVVQVEDEENNSSSQLSSSPNDEEEQTDRSITESHPQEPSSRSPQPQNQPLMPSASAVTSNPGQLFTVRFLFEVILEHLIANLTTSSRSSRLEYLLLQLKEGVGLKEVMNKLDKKDLAFIAQHKKFIEIFANNLSSLLRKQEYAKFAAIDQHKTVLRAYASLVFDVNLAQLRTALAKEQVFAAKQNNQLGKALIEQLLQQTRLDFQSNKLKYVTEEQQLMMRRIEGKDVEKLMAPDPFTDFGLEKDTQFDQVSKYGIFCNRQEEEQLSKEGVFNYRLHRTMFLVERLGIMSPQDNLKLGKSLALFLIKLTDHHITQVLQTAINIADFTVKPTSADAVIDQVSYFSAGRMKDASCIPSTFQGHEETSICRLKYPSYLKLYRNLRITELIEEERLYDNLQPEMMDKLTRGKKRLSKDERIVVEYFGKRPQAIDYIAKLRSDTEKDATGRQKSTINRIAIQPRHVRHFLENHPFYRNHQILWRFNIVY